MYLAKKQWQRANIAIALLIVYVTSAAVNGFTFSDNNTAVQTAKIDKKTVTCEDGLLLSLWRPQDNLTLKDIVIRGAVYFSVLVYLFIGVSIVSDRFMAAIEVITSKEKEVKVRKLNGETQIVVVRVWNETVANLVKRQITFIIIVIIVIELKCITINL